MKPFLILCTIGLVVSCSPSRYYQYNAKMTHPIQSERLFYENDTFSISFGIESKYIDLSIYNKTNTGLRINWDEVSFSLNGETFRAVHKNTGVLNVNLVQPPTTIPPKSNLNDFILPADNVVFINSIYSGGKWYSTSPIFPEYDYGNKRVKGYIERLKGVRLTVYLPLYIEGKLCSYYYDIEVSQITQSKTKPK